MVVFGEWFGPGVQRGCEASAAVDGKKFAVFAAMVLPSSPLFDSAGGQRPTAETAETVEVDPVVEADEYVGSVLLVEPLALEALIPDNRPETVHVLPWFAPGELQIDFDDPKPAAACIAELAAAVGEHDPWIATTFGVEGPGEGLVFYPQLGNQRPLTRSGFSGYAFKAKCERHSVQKTKEKVPVKAEVLPGLVEFAESYVTGARLAQCTAELESELGRPLTRADTGSVMRWMHQDILKEGQLDLATSGLEWKQVAKAVSARVTKLYMRRFALL